MRIHPLSDLHNEFALFTPEVRDANVVILVGDIDLGVRGIKWARQAFDCPVLYVPGNHEFYRGHLTKTLQAIVEPKPLSGGERCSTPPYWGDLGRPRGWQPARHR